MRIVADVTVCVLGLLEVRQFGTRVDIPVGLARRTLLSLAIARHRGHTDLELIDRLWGDDAPPSALASLRNTVARLRVQLGPEVIERTPRGYRLAAGRVSLDVDDFDENLAAAQRLAVLGDSEQALVTVRRALQLVRERPYLEVADEWWAATASTDVSERIAVAEELWADLVLRLGRAGGEIGRLHRAARARPHREIRWKQLTMALIASDRRVDAVRAVHEARQALAEHGFEVSRELSALEATALAGGDG